MEGHSEAAEAKPTEEVEGLMVEKSVEVGTPEGVNTLTAVSDTHAVDVERTTEHHNMNKKWKGRGTVGSEEQGPMKRPRYARILFGLSEIGNTPTAMYTETASAVPDVLVYELGNAEVGGTVHDHLHLFAIISPVNPQALRVITAPHPNRALVESLCTGFERGFWPYADTSTMHTMGPVMSKSAQSSEKTWEFLRQQHDAEIAAGQYLRAFPALLPSMVVQPIFAIPKKGTDKLQLINNHSAGGESLNSLIPTEGGFMQLDTLQDLGLLIWQEMRRTGGWKPAWLFKSDVSEVYRWILMHPHWQVRQATEAGGAFHVDRCAIFGNRTSGRIWSLLLSMCMWSLGCSPMWMTHSHLTLTTSFIYIRVQVTQSSYLGSITNSSTYGIQLASSTTKKNKNMGANSPSLGSW